MKPLTKQSCQTNLRSLSWSRLWLFTTKPKQPDHDQNTTIIPRTGFAKSIAKKNQTPKTTQREMSNIEKGMIIAFCYCLWNITLVAQIIGRPWTTIKSFLVWACGHQLLDNLPCPSHTPSRSELQRRTIIRQVKPNCMITRSDFQDQYTPGIAFAIGNKTKLEAFMLSWALEYDDSCQLLIWRTWNQ